MLQEKSEVRLHLRCHQGAGLIQNLLGSSELISLRGLGQSAGLNIGHLIHIEARVPPGELVIRDRHRRVHSGKEHL